MSVSIARLLPTCSLNLAKPETELWNCRALPRVHGSKTEGPGSLAATFQTDLVKPLALHINQMPTQERVTQCSVSNLEINKPALTCGIFVIST
jgi:hypothetical protein